MLKEQLKQLKRMLGGESSTDTMTESDVSMSLNIDGVKHEVTSISEIIPTDTEKQEMDVEVDEGYLQYSAEVVGFETVNCNGMHIVWLHHILIARV